MQIACSIVEALNDTAAIDAVQPMKTGWWIYLHMQADQDRLVAQGMSVAGKHIQLRSETYASHKRTVKVIVQDLLLHAVDNEQVLEAMSARWLVASEVLYSMVWHQGQPTSICNGDRYMYVMEEVAATMPETLDVGEYITRIFKPPAMM